MLDSLNLAMLIAASAGSLIFGVLAAYGLLRAGFALMGLQHRRTVALKPQNLPVN
jgi:hypothetical protein